MDSGIAALIGVLLGGLLTGLITWFQLRHQKNREQKKLVLTKLEELHKLLGDYAVSCYGFIGASVEYDIDRFDRMLKHLSPSHKPRERQRPDLEPVTLERIYLLIGVYAPELMTHLERLKNASEEFFQEHRALTQVKLQVVSDVEKLKDEKPHFNALIQHHITIDTSCWELQQEVVKVSRKHL